MKEQNDFQTALVNRQMHDQQFRDFVNQGRQQ